MNRRLAMLLAVIAAVLVPAGLLAADERESSAASSKVKVRFLACVEFLTPPVFPPCVSREFNGDSIQTTGSGLFKIEADGDGEIEGSGTFIHRNPAGVEVARGTWRAKKFLAYRTYGCAGCPALPPGSEGGNLLFTAELRPAGGNEFDATLEINCALGTPPPNRLYEGVEVRVLGLRFDQAEDGATLFIRE